MVIKTELKCIVVLGVSSNIFFDSSNNDHNVFVSEIMQFSGALPFTPDSLEGIDIINDPVLMIRGSTKKPRILTRDLYTLGGIKKYYFTFSVYVEADVEELKKVYVIEEETEEGSIKKPLEDGEIMKIGGENICMELHILVCDLLLCGSIAVPGGVTAGPILLFVGNRFFEKHQGTSDYLAEAVRKARELGWPTIRKLSIIDVWNWIISIPEFKLKVGRGKVGRAVAALSQILWATDSSSGIIFIWSLLALEGLYTTGHEGIKSQLMEKTELFLGERSSYKKKFNRIYDFRSRFVHGDVDLDFAYSQLFSEGHNVQFWIDAWEVGEIAASMLIATLQELIMRNWVDIDFTYQIKGKILEEDESVD